MIAQTVSAPGGDELTVAQQRLEVAVALVGMITDEVEAIDERHLIVADVVDRWRALTAQERATYGNDRLSFSRLTQFAWDYVDLVETSDIENDPPDEDYNQALFRVWCAHVERLGGRAPVSTET